MKATLLSSPVSTLHELPVQFFESKKVQILQLLTPWGKVNGHYKEDFCVVFYARLTKSELSKNSLFFTNRANSLKQRYLLCALNVILLISYYNRSIWHTRAFFWASIQENLRKYLRGFLSFSIFKLSFWIFRRNFCLPKLRFCIF